jgi:hypothetical protein
MKPSRKNGDNAIVIGDRSVNEVEVEVARGMIGSFGEQRYRTSTPSTWKVHRSLVLRPKRLIPGVRSQGFGKDATQTKNG